MIYTTAAVIWHNPKQSRWELVDERGRVHAWISDEMLFRIDDPNMLLENRNNVIRRIALEAYASADTRSSGSPVPRATTNGRGTGR